MANYCADDIRNIVLLGHAGSGKTTLAEAMLHKAGATTRLGRVEDKSSILDNDELEKEHGHSIDSAVCHVTHQGKKINIIDTPGYPDYLGSALSSLAGVETAIIVIDAAAGIELNTRRLFQAAEKRGMACMIVVNKIDGNVGLLEELVQTIRESFGRECVCGNLAATDGKSVIGCIKQSSGEGAFIDVAHAHTELIDTAVEADETLMERYLAGEEITPDEIDAIMTKAMISRSVIPIVFTSAKEEVGIERLMNVIAADLPSPVNGLKATITLGEGDEQVHNEIAFDADGDPLGLVVRSNADPKTHIKYSTVRLFRGKIKSDSGLHKLGGKKAMRCGHIHKLQGDHLEEIDEGIAGDIVTLAKLEELKILDTVYVGKESEKIDTPFVPVPMYRLAILPKKQGDETKISAAFNEITDTDPTFDVIHDEQTHEVLVAGLGELHVRTILTRMKMRRNIEVDTHTPQIPYRETIGASAKFVEYTHKKQSGGSGQFARVFIDMEPNVRGEGYEFIDKIFGGSIDQPFRPSVDKGCQAAMSTGVVAGFPVVDVKVTLVDGKTHPVDSKDIAFQFAGREAFRKAFMQCKPELLEPIVNMEVTLPSDHVGDIAGDLSSRRGRVQGQDVLPGNMTVIKAQVPLSEIQQYNSQLKSVTSGQGSYSMELSHYEPVPPNVMQQIVEKQKATKAEAVAH